MDVISFFHAIILDTLQSEFQAGDGEAKALRPTKNLIICAFSFRFSHRLLQHRVYKNKTQYYAQKLHG